VSFYKTAGKFMDLSTHKPFSFELTADHVGTRTTASVTRTTTRFSPSKARAALSPVPYARANIRSKSRTRIPRRSERFPKSTEDLERSSSQVQLTSI